MSVSLLFAICTLLRLEPRNFTRTLGFCFCITFVNLLSDVSIINSKSEVIRTIIVTGSFFT